MTIEERMEFLTQSIESHDRQIGEITDKLAQVTDRIDSAAGAIEKLTQATANNADAITSLIAAMQAHEGRISDLEGGRRE